jgi:hypothetical protein
MLEFRANTTFPIEPMLSKHNHESRDNKKGQNRNVISDLPFLLFKRKTIIE